MSWPDSTIIVPVTVYHQRSCVETYSRYSQQPIYRMVTVIETLHRQDTHSAVELTALRQCRVVAFVGIGNPWAFVSTLTQLGVEVVALLVFPDHTGLNLSHRLSF